MVADLTPSEAKAKEDESGGWTLRENQLCHESLDALQRLLEAEVQETESGAKKCEALVHPVGASNGYTEGEWGVGCSV